MTTVSTEKRSARDRLLDAAGAARAVADLRLHPAVTKPALRPAKGAHK